MPRGLMIRRVPAAVRGQFTRWKYEIARNFADTGGGAPRSTFFDERGRGINQGAN